MNFKELIEERNNLLQQLEEMNTDCEKRADKSFTEDEQSRYDELKKKLDGIDSLVERAKELKKLQSEQNGGDGKGGDKKDKFCLARYIRDAVSDGVQGAVQRANMTFGSNGAVVPETIAHKIIDTLKNICPVYELATKLSYKGSVDFPVVDETSDHVQVAYENEFATLTSHVSNFDKVSLSGHLFAALSLISKSLINNAEVDVDGFIITKMAQACKEFLEHELLIGTTNKMTGWASSGNVVTSGTTGAIDADDLIALQDSIIDAYQSGCVWIMKPATRTMIRQLKDGQQRYLLNNDVTTGFNDMLLGKRVYVSDQMPAVASNALAVYYGDPSGLYVNIRENMNIEVLREVYATQHAIGINLWMEADSKIVEPQKLAVLKVK